jgi:hypothetical protein
MTKFNSILRRNASKLDSKRRNDSNEKKNFQNFRCLRHFFEKEAYGI